MNPQYDVIVVGASAAGTTAAAELAAAGRSVLLLDRAVFPRDKPCGEGLMPAGAAVIQEWGLLPTLLERGASENPAAVAQNHREDVDPNPLLSQVDRRRAPVHLRLLPRTGLESHRRLRIPPPTPYATKVD